MADQDATRKLAAILSADVVGYSRLMGEDEQATIATLSASRDIFTDTITAHQGRVVDTAGDSVLAVFPSVVETVQGAVDVQQTLQTHNETPPSTRRMLFRIGVNLGDVLEKRIGVPKPLFPPRRRRCAPAPRAATAGRAPLRRCCWAPRRRGRRGGFYWGMEGRERVYNWGPREVRMRKKIWNDPVWSKVTDFSVS